MTTWVSIVTSNFFFFFTSVNMSYNDVLREVYVSINSRILFLCIINEIIMKIKLNKILFLNLFFMRSLVECLYQVRVITVFTVFQLLTDFVCLYNYEF